MMCEARGYFDNLYFTESEFGMLRFDGLRLHIPVKGLFLLAGHPFEIKGYGPYEGEFIFDGVASSRRTIMEYIGDSRNPMGFKPCRDVVDEIPGGDIQTGTLQEFGFEGILELPRAWIVDWIVQAKSFVLRI
jgi:hypothetical protein